ncbi:RES family NAD+ phosphorylase [Micrococcaceae bacterium RIT802]|nr:RES family NAD+ phosphorylase [Micrococcaceae bacterium RIT 802]
MALKIARPPSATVWRIGYQPDPLAWADWSYATNGRFQGRWDDPDGRFRTLYFGDALLNCLVELLAHARREKYLAEELAGIDEDPEDAAHYPTIEPGKVDRAWLLPRCAAEATLTGQHCDVTDKESIAALHPHFIRKTLEAGHYDFDAALLKNGEARSLTQAVAAYLFLQDDVNGVRFTSRHGEDMGLWSVFEQAETVSPTSPYVLRVGVSALTEDMAEIGQAFEILGLEWND